MYTPEDLDADLPDDGDAHYFAVLFVRPGPGCEVECIMTPRYACSPEHAAGAVRMALGDLADEAARTLTRDDPAEDDS